MPKYSAVIIARNEEKHIKKTINSILNQSISPYRVVVVDDCSTDATSEILNKMPVTVKRIPHKEFVAGETHAEIRNVGYAYIKDDPVDWVYSGDADIILPPKYCETIMKHAEENDAYIGAGIIHDLDELPMAGCCMIKHDWLRSIGMKTKWDGIYLCIMALSEGKNTLVRHADDCTVVTQRPSGSRYANQRKYGKGRIVRRMGASPGIVLWGAVVCAKRYGLREGIKFLQGGFGTKVEVSNEMKQMYRVWVKNDYLRRFGRHHRMLDKRGHNLICHPTVYNAKTNQTEKSHAM